MPRKAVCLIEKIPEELWVDMFFSLNGLLSTAQLKETRNRIFKEIPKHTRISLKRKGKYRRLFKKQNGSLTNERWAMLNEFVGFIDS